MKKFTFAVMAFGMLMLASCSGNSKKAEDSSIAAQDDSSAMIESETITSETEVVGMEVQTPPAGDSNGVIAGAVDQVTVEE